MMPARNGHSSEAKMVAEMSVYSNPELKELTGEAADKAGIPLSEYVVRVLADHFKRPDLRVVPRKSIGRPRKKVSLNAG